MSVGAPPSGWETRHVGLSECRAELSDDKKIRGYGIVFHVKSQDLGGFREIILPSAVDRTLREGIDVRSYVNHDMNRILGRKSAGTLSLKKDNYGLHTLIDPPNTTYAKDIMTSIRRGDVSGMSFRFRTVEDRWHLEDEEPIREVVDMRIGEVGPVSEPAYEQTEVSVRSLRAFQDTLVQRRSRVFLERYLTAKGIVADGGLVPKRKVV